MKNVPLFNRAIECGLYFKCYYLSRFASVLL